jgi:hypothetical protein
MTTLGFLAHAVVDLIPKIERGIAMGFNPGAQPGHSGPLTEARNSHGIVGLGHVCALQRRCADLGPGVSVQSDTLGLTF